jgi:hypothetical protein
MINIYSNKPASCKYLILIFFIFSAFKPISQANDIILHNERMSITPKEFYIADVVDERDNHNPFAQILSANPSKDVQPKTYPVDLRGGTFSAVKQFILQALPADKSLRGIIIGLKTLTVNEKAVAGNRAEGHIAFAMSFYLNNGGEDKVHLADYNGSALYNRTPGNPQQVEPTLRRVLQSGITYLNNLMNQRAGKDIKLAKNVKLKFIDYGEKAEGDTIYYNIKRPLTWADFRSKVPSTRFDAEVFPTIGYTEQNEINNSIVTITIALKTCIPKSACWVREGSRTDYTLNHEQRHFDIAAIAAERFKRNLLAEDLTVANYEGPINVAYLDAYRDMNKMQKQYDNETRHGSDKTEQQLWNVKIDKELKEMGVK